MAAELKASPREDLRNSATRKIRKDGYIPSVLYGNKIESQTVSVESIDFIKLVREVGKNGLFSLNIDGKGKHQVMVHDLQRDPLKNEYIHIDFFEVDMTSEINADVSVQLIGEAPGSKDGGVVSHLLYEVTVNCLPADIPEGIEVDISNLTIGDSIQIADIRSHVDVEIVNEDDETVVSVLAPTIEEEPEASDEDEDAEPEVIGEKEESEE